MTTKLSFSPNAKLYGEKTGLTVMGLSYAAVYLESSADGMQLIYATCKDADKGSKESKKIIKLLNLLSIFHFVLRFFFPSSHNYVLP